MRSFRYEHAFLDQAIKRAGLSFSATEDFTDEVFERLQKGAQEYGDSAFGRQGAELLREIAEEAADVAGWSLMRAQLADDLSDDDAQMLRLHLVEATALAAQLWQAVKQAQEIEREAPRVARGPAPEPPFSHYEES